MLKTVWIIADSFVVEAHLGGKQLGLASELDMTKYKVVAEYSQSEIDSMFEEFHKEQGYYPDT